MCKAVEEMLNEKHESFREEGRAEGRAEGHAEGFLEALAGLVRDGLLSSQTAASRANMSQSEFEAVMKKFAT